MYASLRIGVLVLCFPHIACQSPVDDETCDRSIDCELPCYRAAANVATPLEVPDGGTQVTSAECTLAANVEPGQNAPQPENASCECQIANDVIILYADSQDSCLVYGRMSNCLYARSDFPGCEEGPSGGEVCSTECERVVRAIDEDRSTVLDVTVARITCENGGVCGCILEHEDVCFDAYAEDAGTLDCSEIDCLIPMLPLDGFDRCEVRYYLDESAQSG
jgi:hypothetical protein